MQSCSAFFRIMQKQAKTSCRANTVYKVLREYMYSVSTLE